jgi:hypothetical protein
VVISGLLVCCAAVPAMADEPAAPPPPRAAMMVRAAVAGIAHRAESSRGAAMCFVENPTPEELANIMTMYQALPPSLVNSLEPRFRTANTVWTNNGTQGASGQARAASLTYSFPADGVGWGSGAASPNNLHANLQTLFGNANEDRGLELFRQALCSWRRFGGLTYSEVADDNSAFTTSTGRLSTRGDIRIGSIPQGLTGVLAYNQFPSSGADMTINSDYFPVAQGALGSSANVYRYLRDVVAHEHGHGLGYIHPVPCNSTKLMEPFIHTNTDGCLVDEFRGIGRNYGDRRSGNNSGAAAFDYGNLTTPILKSIVDRNLSTNGAAGANGSSADWFKFTIDAPQTIVITAQPTGGTYTEGQQSSGCTGTTASVNASAAGDLNIELRSGANGSTVVQSSAVAAAGTAEVLSAGSLSAGTYWVRVFDSGPNTSANQTVQLYDLTLRVGTAKAPPRAVAGLHKRIQASKNCFFFGDLNSFTTDTGPTGGANSLSYFWDLDGNGTFGGGIDSTAAEPVVTGGYPSNGTYAVTLRVTDSNALTSTDTINVVVFGATANITGVSPSSADAGSVTPVTISGVNFKGVTSASQITVSGAGVTVTGTPVVNALGTQITGLSFAVALGAEGLARDVSVTNSDGSNSASGIGTGVGKFTVNGQCAPPTILSQPQDQLACPGGAATLSVGASAGTAGLATYQWRRNGQPIQGATATVLILSPVTPDKVGDYDCIVTSTCGSTPTAVASVTLETSGIMAQPTAQVVCPGGSATFTIGVTGTGELQWHKDGGDIPGATGSTLTINPVGPDDVGVYDCTMFTQCDIITSDPVTLSLGSGAAVQTQPGSQSVCAGSPVTLSFAVDGATGFQWRKGGEDLPGETNPTLSIAAASPVDAGDYDCIAASPCGGTTSNVATVAVCSSVEILTSPIARSVCPGGSTTFTVNASGSALTYQWRKTGSPIDGATSASLTISLAGAADTGTYDCVVGNCCQQMTSGQAGLSICVGDYNCSGGLAVDDIFDFLNGWFAAAPAADVNRVDGLTVQDIFDFLNAWLAGC